MTAHEAIRILARMVAELQTDLKAAEHRIHQLEHQPSAPPPPKE